MIFSIFAFAIMMVVTAILFGSWVVVSVGKLFWRALTCAPKGAKRSAVGLQCMNPGCRCGNPPHAHYCRRCGADLTEPAPRHRMAQPRPRFDPTNGSGRQVARI